MRWYWKAYAPERRSGRSGARAARRARSRRARAGDRRVDRTRTCCATTASPTRASSRRPAWPTTRDRMSGHDPRLPALERRRARRATPASTRSARRRSRCCTALAHRSPHAEDSAVRRSWGSPIRSSRGRLRGSSRPGACGGRIQRGRLWRSGSRGTTGPSGSREDRQAQGADQQALRCQRHPRASPRRRDRGVPRRGRSDSGSVLATRHRGSRTHIGRAQRFSSRSERSTKPEWPLLPASTPSLPKVTKPEVTSGAGRHFSRSSRRSSKPSGPCR